MFDKNVDMEKQTPKHLDRSIRQELVEQFEVDDKVIYLIEDGFHCYYKALYELKER